MSEVHEGKIFMGRRNFSNPNAPTPWNEVQRAAEEMPP